ncbi:M48 family metalloprotease [Dactylosporangium sp. NPDC000555]|uniref:M48 family metalloprotease n=1 Tax=Dactylosporangium sp. NPDC000555 TaxID=3154260 RepID=UPI003317BC4C
MYCDQCGQSLPPGAAACPRCGAPAEPLPAVPAQRAPAAGEWVRALVSPAVRLGHGPGARAWLAAILLRNLRGTAAGIIGAWFNVPFTIMMAASGAVIGALVGLFHGSFLGPQIVARVDRLLQWVLPLPFSAGELLPSASIQIGGIVGAIAGGLNGAWTLGLLAFAEPWKRMYASDALWPVSFAVGQVVVAVFVGALYLLWSVATEPLRLRVSGARRLSRREAEWLMPMVHEVAARLGLRSLPHVLIDDRREANAYAGIRHIVVNQGLLDQLDHDRGQVSAVIAHELAHWRDGDAIAIAWAKGVTLPLYLLYEIATRLTRMVHNRPLHYLIRFVFWSVIVTVRYIVIPIQASAWRCAEYRADAAAVRAGYRTGLHQALSYLHHSFDGERSGWDAAILAMHPPTELRLEAIEEPGRSYPLRDDGPARIAMPARPSLSTVERDR